MNDTDKTPDRENRPASKTWLGGLGMGFCSGGGAMIGINIMRQVQAPPGQTFYTFMIVGGILILIGFFIMRSLRPKRG